MKSRLIYITHGCPYNSNDIFPMDELPFVAGGAWKTVVMPRLRGDSDSPSDVLPEYVELSDTLLTGKVRKASFLLTPNAADLIFAEYHTHMAKGKGIFPRLSPMLRAVGTALHAASAMREFILKRGLHKAPLVIYSFWFDEAVIGLAALKLEFPHIRLVTRVHGGDMYPDRHPGNYLPFRFQRVACPDHVAAISRAGLDFMRAEGYQEEKISLHPLGVPQVEKLAPCSGEGLFSIISCAFMVPVKRLHLLGTALRALAMARPDVKFTWRHVGGGPEFAKIADIAAILLGNLPNFQVIFHGTLPVREVRSLMANTPLDALVSVSESEGVPVSMQEAAACGIPLLSTDVGGTSDIVRPETGILIPPDFSEAQFISAAEALMRWKNPDIRRRVATFCREHFSLERNYRRFVFEVLAREMEISEKILKAK